VWKGGHFEREVREKQPKGTADTIMMGELSRPDNLHGEGRYHTTKGYHPSVRILPSYARLRRQRDDSKARLIASSGLPRRQQRQHDDPEQCERDSKRPRVDDNIARSSTEAAEAATASPASRHHRHRRPAPVLVARAGGSLLASVHGAEVWRAGIVSKQAVPVFKKPTRSCEIGDACELPHNAPIIAGPGKFIGEVDLENKSQELKARLLGSSLAREARKRNERDDNETVVVGECVDGVLQHLKAKARPAKARPRPKVRASTESSDVAEDINRRIITRPTEEVGRSAANLVGSMHVANSGRGSGCAAASTAVEYVSDLDADYQRWFRHAPDVTERVSEIVSGCLQRHHTCGHESEVSASKPVVVDHEGPTGGKAGKTDG